MSGMLKRIIAVCMLLCALCTAAAAEFDLSMFEFDGEYKDMYTVTREEDAAFIDAGLSAEQMSFSHKNASRHYYSTLYADIVVLHYRQSGEYAVPRIWIDYTSGKDALHVKTVEFTLMGKGYSFEVNKSDITQLNKGGICEEVLIRLGVDAAEFMGDWFDTAKSDGKIYAKLIGESDEVTFELPDLVADSAGLMWELFSAAGGKETLDKVNQTPISVSKEAPARRKPRAGVLQYHDLQNNTVFDVPAGWALSELPENEEDAIRFEWSDPNGRGSAYIVYVSSDLWKSMAGEYADIMQDMERSDLDSMFSAEDVASMYEIDARMIKKVTRGSHIYFMADVEKENKPGGYINRFYLNIVNGRSYLFEYTGSSARIDDFDNLVGSVEHFRSM